MPVDPAYLHLVYPGEKFPAYLYGRASHDPTKKGRSVSTQLSEGRGLCEQFGWPIVGVFDKDVDRSASRHAKRERADFEAMLEGIAIRSCRIVVAWEASRYYRDLEAYVRLRNACLAANVLLCYNGAVYDLSKRQDRKATAQDALQAEDEAEGIRDRQLRTQRKTAEQGRPMGRAPYGYKRTYDPDSGELVDQVPHPDRAPYVREIFNLFAAGETGYSIVQWLNGEPGARHPGGRPWEIDRLNVVLRNPAYIGRRIFQGKDVGEGTWKPIIEDTEVFYQVQRILSNPARRTQRDSRATYLLSFVALCGECETLPPIAPRQIAGAETAEPIEPAEAVAYDDARCALVRPLYDTGFRPTARQVLRALGEPGLGEEETALADQLRAEVESHEPGLGRLRAMKPPLLKIGPAKEKRSYICSTRWDTSMRTALMEAYVEEGVLAWLKSDAARAAFERGDQDVAVAAARARLGRLTAQLDEARALAGKFGPDNQPMLSVLSLASLEQGLGPQITAAKEEVDAAAGAAMTPLLRGLVGQRDADARWEGLSLSQKRTVLREVVTVRLFKAHVRGAQKILPGRIVLSFVGEPDFKTGD